MSKAQRFENSQQKIVKKYSTTKKKNTTKTTTKGNTLFDKLKELRTQLAQEKNVPPYVIFSDKSLRAIARKKPTTNLQFLDIKGVGPKKLQDYAKPFIKIIKEHK